MKTSLADCAEPLVGRAAGMLAGVALGDAFGMPAEFLNREQIRAWYGEITELRAAHPDHPHHRLPTASVTDDTDHTIILARLLLEHGEITPQALAAALLAWSQELRVRDNHFVGPSTQRALAALQQGAALEEVPRNGTSVGAAMRTAALAIAIPDIERLTRQVVASCAVTHYTHNAISGALAMAYGQFAALLPDATPHTVLAAMQSGAVQGRHYGAWSWTPPIEQRIAFVLDWATHHTTAQTLDLLAEIIGTDLYPEQLVPCTAGLLLVSDGDPPRAIRLAANLGGDTDTLACMVGSLCGGLAGFNSFPPDQLAQVEMVNQLDLCDLARCLVALREIAPLA